MAGPSITKISKPRISDTYPRERLFGLLDDAHSRPVTWISAPAGSGKTTLVSSYLDNRILDSLWYQIDEGDSDIATFFYYLGLAMKAASPRHKKPLPLLMPENLSGFSIFARNYFEALFARLKRPFILVFDNYQDVPTDARLHEAIQDAVSVLPEGFRIIIIISRTEPLPAFSRLVAYHRLYALTAKNMLFTEEESIGFIGMNRGMTIPDTVAVELHERTQGWAAGMVMLLEMASTSGLEAGLVGSRIPEEMFGYFARELFDKIDEATQDFLLKTAILPVMSLSGAELMSGNQQAKNILAELGRKNFFVVERLYPKPTYQYHPLFREFLLERANNRFDIPGMAAMRSAAAAILEQSGHVEDAVILYHASRGWKNLVPLILKNAQSLIGQGRNMTLREWINLIPEGIANENPWLIFWSGVSGITFRPAENRKLLERAFERFASTRDESGMLLAWSVITQSYIFELNDFRRLDRWIGWIDGRLGDGLSFTSPEIEANVVAGMTGVLAWRQPSRPDRDVWLEKAIRLPEKTSNVDVCVRSYSNSAIFHVWMGDFAQCHFLLNAMRAMIDKSPVSPLRLIILKIVEAMTYNSSVVFGAQALDSVAQGLEIARESGVSLMTGTLYLQGAVGALNRLVA